jgi:hypothetical protein
MVSEFAEYCLHVRQLQPKIARFAIWINIPAALLNFVLAQLGDLGLLPMYFRSTPISRTLSLLWFVVSAVPLVLLAEFWEMWWNPFARDAHSSQSSRTSDNARQCLLKGNRRVVQRVFGIAV